MKTGQYFFLIDDDIDDQEIFQLVLQSLDETAACATADNGVMALSYLTSGANHRPDYIFIDVNMPMMNGLECLTKIRSIRTFDESIIVMYSTTSDAKIVRESKALGANHFLVKQAGIEDLKKQLFEIL